MDNFRRSFSYDSYVKFHGKNILATKFISTVFYKVILGKWSWIVIFQEFLCKIVSLSHDSL